MHHIQVIKLLPTFVSCSSRLSGAHSLERVCILELARVFILKMSG